MKHGKKYVDSLKLIDKSKNYEASEAIALCVQTGKSYMNFNSFIKLSLTCLYAKCDSFACFIIL